MAPHDVPANIVDLLSLAERRVTARLVAVLAEHGGSLDEWRVLSLLRSGGGHAMSAVAEAAILPPPTLTKRVDRMVADNLVHRRSDPDDRRRVLLVLAPRGRALHDRLAPHVEREQSRLSGIVAVGADPAAFAGVLAALAELTPEPAPR